MPHNPMQADRCTHYTYFCKGSIKEEQGGWGDCQPRMLHEKAGNAIWSAKLEESGAAVLRSHQHDGSSGIMAAGVDDGTASGS